MATTDNGEVPCETDSIVCDPSNKTVEIQSEKDDDNDGKATAHEVFQSVVTGATEDTIVHEGVAGEPEAQIPKRDVMEGEEETGIAVQDDAKNTETMECENDPKEHITDESFEGETNPEATNSRYWNVQHETDTSTDDAQNNSLKSENEIMQKIEETLLNDVEMNAVEPNVESNKTVKEPKRPKYSVLYPVSEQDLITPQFEKILPLTDLFRKNKELLSVGERGKNKKGAVFLSPRFKTANYAEYAEMLPLLKNFICKDGTKSKLMEVPNELGREHYKEVFGEISRRNLVGTEETASVFVNNIPKNASQEMIHFLYPSARSIQLPVDTESVIQGYAIVEFASLEEAKSMVWKNRDYRCKIGDNYLRLHVIGHENRKEYSKKVPTELSKPVSTELTKPVPTELSKPVPTELSKPETDTLKKQKRRARRGKRKNTKDGGQNNTNKDASTSASNQSLSATVSPLNRKEKQSLSAKVSPLNRKENQSSFEKVSPLNRTEDVQKIGEKRKQAPLFPPAKKIKNDEGQKESPQSGNKQNVAKKIGTDVDQKESAQPGNKQNVSPKTGPVRPPNENNNSHVTSEQLERKKRKNNNKRKKRIEKALEKKRLMNAGQNIAGGNTDQKSALSGNQITNKGRESNPVHYQKNIAGNNPYTSQKKNYQSGQKANQGTVQAHLSTVISPTGGQHTRQMSNFAGSNYSMSSSTTGKNRAKNRKRKTAKLMNFSRTQSLGSAYNSIPYNYSPSQQLPFQQAFGMSGNISQRIFGLTGSFNTGIPGFNNMRSPGSYISGNSRSYNIVTPGPHNVGTASPGAYKTRIVGPSYNTGTQGSSYNADTKGSSYNAGTKGHSYNTGTQGSSYNARTKGHSYNSGNGNQNSSFNAGNQNSSCNAGTQGSSYNTGTKGSSYNAGTKRPSYNSGTKGSSYNARTKLPSYNTGNQNSPFNAGSQGFSYNVGTKGPSYDMGTKGTSYNAGTQGSSVNAGTQGSSANAGTQGSSYDSVIKGSSYDTGIKGSPYNAGTYNTGTQGPSYDTGAQGFSYYTGAQGSSYDTGAQGSSYGTGPQGSSYNIDTQGSSYNTGTKGSSYNTETPGSSYNTGNQGPQPIAETLGSTYNTGIQGSSYNAGTQGSSFNAGNQGSSYATGTQGSSYATGTQGSSYATGTQGSSYNIGTQGSSYNIGTQGSLYNTGTQGSSYNTGTQDSSYNARTADDPYSTGSYNCGSTEIPYKTGSSASNLDYNRSQTSSYDMNPVPTVQSYQSTSPYSTVQSNHYPADTTFKKPVDHLRARQTSNTSPRSSGSQTPSPHLNKALQAVASGTTDAGQLRSLIQQLSQYEKTLSGGESKGGRQRRRKKESRNRSEDECLVRMKFCKLTKVDEIKTFVNNRLTRSGLFGSERSPVNFVREFTNYYGPATDNAVCMNFKLRSQAIVAVNLLNGSPDGDSSLSLELLPNSL